MKLAGISYLSPVVRYDNEAKVVIVQHRDTQTGKVSRQFPSEEAVRDLRQSVLTGAESASRAAPARESKPAPEKAPATDPPREGESVSLTV
jgi:hypothetical protein